MRRLVGRFSAASLLQTGSCRSPHLARSAVGATGQSLTCVSVSATRHCATAGGKGSASSAAEAFRHPEIFSQINDWNDSFGEARELIKDAMDSVGTIYFSEDVEDAAKQTADTFERWARLKKSLSDSGEAAAVERLEREHALKMNQLQQELEAAQHAGGE